MASRVRTLPASVAPVLVGTALAGYLGVFHPLRFVAALIGAMFIQVGTNLSNDYSDARRGADSEDRLGPVRVTAGGLVPPRRVLVATYVSFGVAVLAGVYLIVVAGWQLLLVGAASILAGVLYTGGPRPYGYEGLGEVFVFLFFGIVAVAGSFFVQVRHLNWEAFALAVPVGLIATAILVVNNIRDLETDRRAGKRTLAVRLGRERTRTIYAVIVYLAFLLAPITWMLRSPESLDAPALAQPPPRRGPGAHRAQPDRWHFAERGARPQRDAPAGLLRSALGGPPPEPVKLTDRAGGGSAARPLRLGLRATEVRELLLVRLEDAEGWVGLGEAAPLESYDGVRLEDCRAALEDCRERPGRSDGSDRAALLRRVRPGRGPAPGRWRPSTCALGISPAAGRREPVWRLLGARVAPAVEVNHTIARR